METKSVKLAYFSPTGTTRAVVQGIAQGLEADVVQEIDATLPEARNRPLELAPDDLLVIGVPVYMGRVPALLGDWLDAIKAQDTPAVCVVVYGNRAFENALLELKDILKKQGCVPFAGGAYIGEHSFASPGAPVALGRPDADDLAHARAFGQRIREKLLAAPSAAHLAEADVPGEYPYAGVTKLWDVDFIAVSDDCVQCGLCAEICPMGAIDPHDSAKIDHARCITCCACIKKCPQNARSMKPGPVMDASRRLDSLYKDPKTPECYL